MIDYKSEWSISDILQTEALQWCQMTKLLDGQP